jgi:hypothetical protein
MPAWTVESIWIFYRKNQYPWARKVYSASVNPEQALTVLRPQNLNENIVKE